MKPQINNFFSITLNDQSYIPSKCICVGRNYMGHIKEMGSVRTQQAVLFNKPNSAISSDLYATHNNETLQFETELCFLMVKNKPVGIGVGLDLTKRTLQRSLKEQGLPWEKSKSFNGSAVFSPFIPTPASLDQLYFNLHVDKQLQQKGKPVNMIFSPQDIFCEIDAFQCMLDGDIVMTGTPEGVGDVVEGAVYSVSLFNNNELILAHTWLAQKEKKLL